jgi:Restriction endonuclease
MGALRLIYDESERQFKRLGWWGDLNLEGTRKVMQGRWRYCLQGNTFYLPQDQRPLTENHRLCWGRIRMEEFEDESWLRELGDSVFDKHISVDPLDYHRQFTGIGFGACYSKRHSEEIEGRLPMRELISQSIIDSVARDPDVLLDLSKRDFERLMAELFARMGFEVDLYRASKDGGIDFLAVDPGEVDPIVIVVQCKHPDRPVAGKKSTALSVATVREVYGVAKANDLAGAIAITSTTYSSDAKAFAELKPEEIALADRDDILEWVRRFRWNKDE